MDHIDKAQQKKEADYHVKISYLEIYQEKLIDLLAGENEQGDLKIRQGIFLVVERDVCV